MADDVRKDYKPLTDRQKEQMATVKAKAQDLLDYLAEEVGESRELSLAKTNIQQGVFWATHHITR